MESTHHISVIVILLMILNITTCNKSNARPVYEVINEQARIDDKIRISSSPSVLPYGNPLAGNSKQNARIHISNQQAMFNAERVRQHRAQLQKLAKNPQPFDSYMKAYHDSQDSHQLVIEQQQATLREIVTKSPPTRVQTNIAPKQKVQNNPVPKQKVLNNPTRKRIQNNPEESRVQNTNQREDSERRIPTRKTTDGTPNRGMKYRNQRSYGPAEYQQYLNPQLHSLLNYVVPGPNYDQGVTIKPHGNIGVKTQEDKLSKLYTEAVPSDTKYVYPKQYSQMLNYKTEGQLENLDTLTKTSQDQVSELNTVQSPAKDAIDIPIDFYFYLRNPTKELSKPYEQLKYAQLDNSYASGYMTDYVKDHIPITEEVDDIEDPNKQKGLKYIAQPETTTTPEETSTIKTNHYYKIEVASQTVSSEHNPKQVKEELYFKQEDTPTYEALHYPSKHAQQTSDTSERYLHHNAQHVGVQHLAEDGTGVSAFGDDDVSKNNDTSAVNVRQKRSELDTESFDVSNKTPIESNPTVTDTPTSESLIRLNPAKNLGSNNFNLFVSPNLPTSDDDYSLQLNQDVDSYDDEYTDYDDSLGNDYSVTTNISPIVNVDANYHLDSQGSYANNFKYTKRVPNYGVSPIHNRIPQSTYGYPHVFGHSPVSNHRYNLPLRYGIPSVNTLSNLGNILEPVYMITQTELKQLLNQQKLNIEHLDVFQLPKANKSKRVSHYPRYHKKRYPYSYRNRKIKSKLHKLNRFL